MLTHDRDALSNKLNIRRSILNSKEQLLKKKNSEIESRLFNKTQYYVIAVGMRPSASDDDAVKVRAYIYYNGYICFYSTQGRAYNQREYIKYIDFVKKAVESKRFQWADFWINKGQIISRDRGSNIHIDTELVAPIAIRSRLGGKVSEISLKLYYEFLRSVNKDDESKLSALETSFDKGILQDKVERIVKNAKNAHLLEKDGEIIVRTNIEGYNYIASHIKEILKSDYNNKNELANAFFSRVFYLEMYGYIGNDIEE